MKNNYFLNKMSKLAKDTRGFSIVELGAVIIIGALMMVPIYSLLYYVTDLKPTDQRMEIIQEALAEHLRITGTLPCPADPTLDIDTNKLAYQGILETSGACTGSGLKLRNNVYIGAVPIYNLKVAVSCATDADDRVSLSSDIQQAVKDGLYTINEIMAGKKADENTDSMRPSAVKCLPNEYVMDEQGHKFVYAVSTSLLQQGADIFDPSIGSVQIKNENGTTVDSSRLFALVSLGEDGVGGYARNGKVASTCAGGLEVENCNGDEVFVSSSENLTADKYFDDRIEYGLAGYLQESNSWNIDAVEEYQARDASGNLLFDENDEPIMRQNTTVALNDNTAMMIGSSDKGNLDTNHAIDGNDSLVVNRGGVKVTGSIAIQAIGHLDDAGVYGVSGGELKTSGNVNADGGYFNIAKTSIAPKFCYDTPLSTDCGANPSSGGSGGTGECTVISTHVIKVRDYKDTVKTGGRCKTPHDRESWEYVIDEKDSSMMVRKTKYLESKRRSDDGRCETDKDETDLNEVVFTADNVNHYKMEQETTTTILSETPTKTVTQHVTNEKLTFFNCKQKVTKPAPVVAPAQVNEVDREDLIEEYQHGSIAPPVVAPAQVNEVDREDLIEEYQHGSIAPPKPKPVFDLAAFQAAMAGFFRNFRFF